MTVASWQPDPTGRHQYRWWDGRRWTDRAAEGDRSFVDPLLPPAGQVEPDPAAVEQVAAAALAYVDLRLADPTNPIDDIAMRGLVNAAGGSPLVLRRAANQQIRQLVRRARPDSGAEQAIRWLEAAATSWTLPNR